jgi:transposase
LEVHQQAFTLILGVVEGNGLLRGRVTGVDSTFLQADASMKAIIRRDTKESYPEFVKRLAEDSGIKEPTEEEARRFDAKRTGKKMSNKEWQSSTDGDVPIAKLKDGRTRMAYKSEHAVDLETGAIVGVTIHPADCSDTATIQETLQVSVGNLHDVHNVDVSDEEDDDQKRPSGSEDRSTDKPGLLVAEKGYHKAVLLRWLKEKGYRTYIPEKRQAGRRRWTDKGGQDTAAAFYENRARVRRNKGKRLQRKRGELIERTFAHICETGAARRTRLRGIDNVSKRYLMQAAAANLGLVMRTLFGRGTPRGLAESVEPSQQAILEGTCT